ncbi:MAG: hypothetical protein H7242_05620 [Microbacteriaceae bacterium]|nr:hypothetical protein [Burkholderiaceae bacterium]
MNFKSIAIAASLVFAAGSTFAADIDLGGAASASSTIAAASTLTDWADTNLTLGAGATNTLNFAAIVQDAADGSGFDVVAQIDQIGATASVAYIYQGAVAAGSVAYIQQNATLNTVAVITQR